MSYKKFYIKVRGSWSKKYEWGADSNKLYCDDSPIGKASSFQDAIELAKSHCGADKDSVVEID